MSTKIVAGMITLMLASFAYTQEAHFYYLEEPVNPRSIGMGCTGTATGTGSFAFYNPAGSAIADSSFVAVEYGQQWGDISRGLVETAWFFPQWFVGASFQTHSLTFQNVDATGNMLPGNSSWQTSLLSVIAGWRSERVKIGAAVNGMQDRLAEGDSWALSASGGVTIGILPDRLLAGASLIHVGSYFRGFDETSFQVDRSIMPTTGRIGGSWNDTIIGKLPVCLSLDVVYSSNNRTVTVPLGFEIRPIQPLAIRLGKRFNQPTDLFSCGIGISRENIAVDAAFTPSNVGGDFENKWLIGLRYVLAARKKPSARKKAAAEPFPAKDTAVSRSTDTVPARVPPPPLQPVDSSAAAVDTGDATTHPLADSTAGVPAGVSYPVVDSVYPAVDSVNLHAPVKRVPVDSVAPLDDMLRIPVEPGAVAAPPDPAGASAVPAGVTDDNPAPPHLPADSTDAPLPVSSPGGVGDAPGAGGGDTVKP